ncbi:unnamed protein product [Paramecium sonneborni]|uniref:Uncharacterized protein n=1 Tax=Paramecium sonneborni TaxID=65129 RepID=A0A8S1QZA6_9CILI|nr:unnamed protein product [Paramecium sonneborni]
MIKRQQVKSYINVFEYNIKSFRYYIRSIYRYYIKWQIIVNFANTNLRAYQEIVQVQFYPKIIVKVNEDTKNQLTLNILNSLDKFEILEQFKFPSCE